MKYDVSPQLAAMPERLAALIAGGADSEMDARMDDFEHTDGLWAGVEPEARARDRYFYRIEELARDILHLVDRDSGAESILPYLLARASGSRDAQQQEQPQPELA